MKIRISKNSKRVVSGIAAVLFLLLLSALTPVSAYQAEDTFRDCATCPEMVVLPAGKFTMGSPKGERGRYGDEGPQRQVIIPEPFAVGKYEVTVGQYAEFVAETKHNTGNCSYPGDGTWRDPGFRQSNEHPVVCVSWDDALTYTYWLSLTTGHEYRLLTETEWEYAARAGTTTEYHFGRVIRANQANYNNKNEGTVVVGSYPSNAFGVYDMHGNVWEWVEDCWHDDYTGAPVNNSAWLSACRKGSEDDCRYYSGDALTICKELIVGKVLRVLRGGSWDNDSKSVRSAARDGGSSAYLHSYLGFRVARTLTP